MWYYPLKFAEAKDFLEASPYRKTTERALRGYGEEVILFAVDSCADDEDVAKKLSQVGHYLRPASGATSFPIYVDRLGFRILPRENVGGEIEDIWVVYVK